MKRIEPGMLCIIIKSTDESDLGKVVTVIRWVGPGSVVPELGGIVYCGRLSGWLCHGDLKNSKWPSDYAGYTPESLMPLSGGDKLQDLETVEDLEATI